MSRQIKTIGIVGGLKPEDGLHLSIPGLSLGQVIGQAHHLRLLTLPRSWRLLRPRTSSTVALACHHIQSHASKSLCLVTLDEVVGRTPCHGCTHRPRKASTKRGNYRRTTFLLGPPPPQVHP